jgi:hypothetical protein
MCHHPWPLKIFKYFLIYMCCIDLPLHHCVYNKQVNYKKFQPLMALFCRGYGKATWAELSASHGVLDLLRKYS